MLFREAYNKILRDDKCTQGRAAEMCGICNQGELGRIISGNINLLQMYRVLSVFGYHVEITNGQTTYFIEPDMSKVHKK